MKKNLLNESEIRKFMKFANLQPLTENFIENSTSNLEEEVVEETTDSVTEGETEATLEEELLSEEDVDVKDLVTKLMQVITDETGVEVSVEDEAGMGDEGELGAEEPEMGDEMGEPEAAIGDEPESGEVVDPAGGEGAPEGAEEEEAEDLMLEMINKVTSRVAARLLKESKNS